MLYGILLRAVRLWISMYPKCHKIKTRSMSYCHYSFQPGSTAIRNGSYGEGIGPIAFEHVQCHGIERSLLSCSNLEPNSSSCSHRDDAGVQCEGEYVCVCVCAKDSIALELCLIVSLL